MKRFLALLLCLLVLFVGCSAEQKEDAFIPPEIIEPTVITSTETHSDTELFAVAVPVSIDRFCLEDGTELYSCASQHMELILPNDEVANKVILNFLNRVDAAMAGKEHTLQEAQSSYDPAGDWFPYFHQIIYSPTRIDHGVLSLFGMQNSYSGGMHGNLNCTAANYDLETGDVLTLGSIMHLDADKEDFIEIVIKKLTEKEEEYYLFDGFEESVSSRLGGDENLYEDFYFTQTGLSFFFSPYEIAPYASGIITVEIPYKELLGLVYDGYFPDERDEAEGCLHIGTFMDTDMEQFTDMAEVNLTTGDEILVVYPDGKIEDIEIIASGDDINMPTYTVFSAHEMTAHNAVILSLSHDEIQNITVTFRTGGGIHSVPLG